MELWNKCSEKLENTLSQEDFNTWIRPLKASVEKNTLSLIAPNDFILDYIEKNLSTEITKILKTQSKKKISLVFKTHTKETFVDKYKPESKNTQTKLVDTYTFDSFVEGKSNHLALAAAQQVAKNPKLILKSPQSDDLSCAIQTLEIKGMDVKTVKNELFESYGIDTRPMSTFGLNGCRISLGIYITKKEGLVLLFVC